MSVEFEFVDDVGLAVTSPPTLRLPVAVILAGGMGTRLRPVTELPKILVDVGGCPLIDWLLDDLRRAGFRDVLLSLGHGATDVIAYVGDGSRWGVSVKWYVEPVPLGTAGAIAAMLSAFPVPAIVMNGDCLFDVDWYRFMEEALTAASHICILASQVDDTSDYGRLKLGSAIAGNTYDVTSFEEKIHGSGWVNAGAYYIHPVAVRQIPDMRPLSMEREFLPNAVDTLRVTANCDVATKFLDIGTPARLADAARRMRLTYANGNT